MKETRKAGNTLHLLLRNGQKVRKPLNQGLPLLLFINVFMIFLLFA